MFTCTCQRLSFNLKEEKFAKQSTFLICKNVCCLGREIIHKCNQLWVNLLWFLDITLSAEGGHLRNVGLSELHIILHRKVFLHFRRMRIILVSISLFLLSNSGLWRNIIIVEPLRVPQSVHGVLYLWGKYRNILRLPMGNWSFRILLLSIEIFIFLLSMKFNTLELF